ncbi:MAG TPA: hypothetical protein DCK95_01250 [Anaerolineaceae bacterium]|nr:hypothetical protein [Anaerolineaceae bacterium]
MRILVLNHEYPPVGGGGGRVARDLNVGFSQQGHEVKLITPQFDDLPDNEYYSHYEIIRVPSMRKYAYRATLKDMSAFIISAYYAGNRLIQTWKPDIIHGHFAVPAGATARMLSRKHKIPYFLTAHLGDIPGGVPEKTERWFQFLYPFTKKIWSDAERIITVSHYTKDLAQQSYPDIQPRVIFNGVDINAIKPAHIAVHDPIQIVFAGRFMEQKNPLMIVEVLQELRELPWKCVMMGDGPLKPIVENAIQKYGLQERFTLSGWINPEQVLETYQNSDILFMPSRSEGLPIAGVQAIATGLAAVLSNVGGCPDLVLDSESGFLINPDNQAEFTSALQKLLTDKDLLYRFKQRSRTFSEKFDIRGIIAQYQDVMEEILNG